MSPTSSLTTLSRGLCVVRGHGVKKHGTLLRLPGAAGSSYSLYRSIFRFIVLLIEPLLRSGIVERDVTLAASRSGIKIVGLSGHADRLSTRIIINGPAREFQIRTEREETRYERRDKSRI